ncbi:DUF11 domain-containing protein, partial [Reichenbachiella sp. MALMAid0571]|uniref:DUF11 domain-containing protein n=1 Tax=Reichenbachiella sp. MALMAid0571 TaxID=3143939 RepID=UPI0032DFB3ED
TSESSGTVTWTGGSLSNGADASISITASVNAGGVYTNTATITSSNEDDPDPSDDQDSNTPVPVPQTDLSIVKTASDATPNVGDNVTFTLTVTNNGPSDATGVRVDDLLPSGYSYVSDDGSGAYISGTGVWTIGGLIDGASTVLQIVATVNATGNYANTATVSGDQDDPGPDPNTDTETPTPGAIDGNVEASDICVGDDLTIQLTDFDNLADGDYQVDYSLNSGVAVSINDVSFTSGSASFDITNPLANSYTIEIVKMVNSSLEELDLAEISNSFNVYELPSITGVSSTSPDVCAGTGSIRLTLNNVPDGSYSLTYADGAFDNVVVLSGSATIDNLVEGDYNDITIELNSCSSVADIDVTLSDPSIPTLTGNAESNPTACSGTDGSITLTTGNLSDG